MLIFNYYFFEKYYLVFFTIKIFVICKKISYKIILYIYYIINYIFINDLLK